MILQNCWIKYLLICLLVSVILCSCNSREKDSEYYFDLGLKNEENGEWTKAEEYYSRAIELDPKFASAYANRGAVRWELDNLDGATTDSHIAIRLDSSRNVAYGNLGVICIWVGKIDSAFFYLTEAIKIDSTFSPAYFHRGMIFYAKKDFNMSLKDLNKLIELEPMDVQAYFLRGKTRLEMGNFRQGNSDLVRAQELGFDKISEEMFDEFLQMLREELNK